MSANDFAKRAAAKKRQRVLNLVGSTVAICIIVMVVFSIGYQIGFSIGSLK